jgi:Purine-cytosine permease and related proteins
MSNKKISDVDYTTSPVDAAGRKSNLSMFMVMLGFTFFSASMWVGQQLAAGLDWWGFVWALILGGLILAAYTGTLGWIGAESGLSLDMLARRSFGTKGSWLPSAMISFTQTGWFGVGLAMFAIPVAKEILHLEVTPDSMPWQGYLLVAVAGILMTASAYFGIKSLTIISYIAVPAVAILGTVAMILAVKHGDAGLVEQFAKGTKDLGIIAGAGLVVGSFVSGGTATPNFTRFAKSGKVGLWITVVAFFIGNSLMFLFGAVSSIYVGGNDIFEVMLNLNLFYLAVLVLGLNIWTTNDNALYTAGLGPVEHLRPDQEDLGHHFRHHRHRGRRVAVLEFLRLAERAELHPAAGGYHPHPPLFLQPWQGGQGKDRGLERRHRRHRRRCGREPRPLGIRLHQRHGRRRPLLGRWTVAQEEIAFRMASTFAVEVFFSPSMISEAEAWISVHPVPAIIWAAFSGVTPPPARMPMRPSARFRSSRSKFAPRRADAA